MHTSIPHSTSMSNDDLIEERRDYQANTLRRDQLSEHPFEQFKLWMAQAREAKLIDASAMAVATSDAQGQPHVRMVLLKQADESGFVWYTYQQSDKGKELEHNPQASLLFYWRELERQVRIEGKVTRLDPADADEYFYSRPEGSRFSAAASVQSTPVENRKVLEDKVQALHKQHPDGNVPRPNVWGGYRLQPHRIEFWQGRADRLHDRFIYVKENNDKQSSEHHDWTISRLSP